MKLATYKKLAEEAVDYWLSSHVDFEGWLEMWVGGEDLISFYAHDKGIENGFCSFPFKPALDKIIAADLWDNAERCPECKNFLFDGEVCDEHSDFEMEYLEEKDRADFESYCEELGFDPSKDQIYCMLRDYAFPVWLEGLNRRHGYIVEELRALQESLKYARTRGEVLAALAWANHAEHCGGELLDRYSSIPCEVIDEISQYGFEAFFGAEALEDFLSDYTDD